MSKSNTRAVLGFAFAVASGALIFASPASAQSLYVASGENAGGSIAERTSVLSNSSRATSITTQRETANIQAGAYTDPSRNVRATLEREHLNLSHPYSVREPSAADRRAVAAQKAQSAYASDTPYVVGPAAKDLSIFSQH